MLLYITCFTKVLRVTTHQKVLDPEKPNTNIIQSLILPPLYTKTIISLRLFICLLAEQPPKPPYPLMQQETFFKGY